MTAFISFPQVLGHEVVADRRRGRPGGRGHLEPGQRVVLNPWLSCGPRGIDADVPAVRGRRLEPVLELPRRPPLARASTPATSTDATGGFAELVPAHTLDGDPGARRHPRRGRRARRPVRGVAARDHAQPTAAGRQGRRLRRRRAGHDATAILRALYPDVEVRDDRRAGDGAGASWPRSSAPPCSGPSRARSSSRQLAAWSGGVLRTPWQSLPFCYPGHIDVVYDTIGKPETFEVGIRVLKGAGHDGAARRRRSWTRCEWTPLYFKEIRWIGSNAFGFEEVDGVRKHGIAHYLDLVQQGRVDLSAMLTHTFPLDEWRDAFTTLARPGRRPAPSRSPSTNAVSGRH